MAAATVAPACHNRVSLSVSSSNSPSKDEVRNSLSRTAIGGHQSSGNRDQACTLRAPLARDSRIHSFHDAEEALAASASSEEA